MSDPNHYTLSLEGTLFFRKDRQRISPVSPIKFDFNGVIACIRSIDKDGNIAGYMKYDSQEDDADMQPESLWEQFQKAIALGGLELDLSRAPELRWVTPNGKKMKRISNTWKFSYLRKEPASMIPSEQLQRIENIFKKLPGDEDLRNMGDDLVDEKKIGKDAADFFFYWVQFNKKYRDCCKSKEYICIKTYIDNLSSKGNILKLIHDRHKSLFDTLANANITSRDKKWHYSDDLNKAMGSKTDTEIVKLAAMCVYELRNRFFHKGAFNFRDIAMASIFIHELTPPNTGAQSGRMKTCLSMNVKHACPCCSSHVGSIDCNCRRGHHPHTQSC